MEGATVGKRFLVEAGFLKHNLPRYKRIGMHNTVAAEIRSRSLSHICAGGTISCGKFVKIVDQRNFLASWAKQ